MTNNRATVAAAMNLSLTKSETPEYARTEEVIHVRDGRGKGIAGSIFRLVDQYWSLDGTLLAEHDPDPDEELVDLRDVLFCACSLAMAFEEEMPHPNLNHDQNERLAELFALSEQLEKHNLEKGLGGPVGGGETND
jgi:hypothetical protein